MPKTEYKCIVYYIFTKSIRRKQCQNNWHWLAANKNQNTILGEFQLKSMEICFTIFCLSISPVELSSIEYWSYVTVIFQIFRATVNNRWFSWLHTVRGVSVWNRRTVEWNFYYLHRLIWSRKVLWSYRTEISNSLTPHKLTFSPFIRCNLVIYL